MKKIIIQILLIVLLITGCNNQKESYSEISFSTWGSRSEISTVQKLISDFEKENPNIKIKLIHIPDKYFQKLHLLIASDLTPDVIFINNLNSRTYIMAKKLEPLNEYIEQSQNLFFKKALEPLSYKNQIYAIPRDVSNMVIYYNKDIFDKYNIPYPTQYQSFDEFLEATKLLTHDNDNDGLPEIFGFGFEKNSIFWLPFLLSNGGGIISIDETKTLLNEANSINSIQFYADLRNKYHVAPKADEQSSLTTSQLFLQGKVAMHLCGRWCALTYKKNAKFNWDVAQFPKGTAGSIVGLDASGWAISSSSKHKNEAWKFIEFMSSDYASTIFAQDGLIVPANKKAAYSKEFQTPPPNSIDVFYKTLDDSLSTPLCSKYAEINDILDETLEAVFDGKKQAKDVINDELINKINQKIN